MWDAASGREPLTLKWHIAAFISVAFSSDGQRIFTGGSDGRKVWEAATKEQVAAWQKDEQDAEQRLAAMKRELANHSAEYPPNS